LESKGQVDQKRMIDVFQDHFLGFGMFDLIFFDNIVFVDGLHSEDFFGFFSLDEKDSSKSASTENDFGRKVIKCDFLLEIFFRKEGFGGPPDHLPFLFLAFKILFIGEIIMHDIITFNLFGALFFFFLLGSGIMDQTQIVLVIDGELVVFDFPVGLEYVVDDLLATVGGCVSE
jgi:hypothetical protein